MRYTLGALGDDTTTTDPSATTTPADTSGAGWLQNLITGVTQLKVSQQQLDAIGQVNQINIQRAAAGLPPIAVPTLGAPSVNVGLSADVQNMLIYGGLAAGAIWLVTSFLKHRG